jgi:hypothetical protein
VANDLKTLYHQRAHAWQTMKELIERDNDWTMVDVRTYEHSEAELDRLTQLINLDERHHLRKRFEQLQ